mmetsp:Transcript_12473/g.20291  ORF Transcript_12473/g.20291 Transcript_12473/m.20291 type:complete len:581 (+) Transcript_12473:30-1772(+)
MKKIIDAPAECVQDMLEGLVHSTPNVLRLPGLDVIIRADIEQVREHKVALISGGGSGHEPSHAGFVGKGMLSAAVCGNVFTSPDVDSIYAAIRSVTGPPGCLLIVKNYTGDKLNFGLAAELARVNDGLKVDIVVVADDVALDIPTANQRGIAGTVLLHKVAGAAAESGASLEQVFKEAKGVASTVATMGVGLSSCIIPAVGKPNFVLGEEEVEIGLGIHGEPGRERRNITPNFATFVATQLIDRIQSVRFGDKLPKRAALLVNGLGGTSLMELYILSNVALKLLESRGVGVERVIVGSLMTSMEMAGASLSLLPVDDHILSRLDADTQAYGWPRTLPVNVTSPRPVITIMAPSSTLVGQQEEEEVEGHDGHIAVTSSVALDLIGLICKALIGSADALTELDAKVGDGDMGVNLSKGAQAVVTELESGKLPKGVAACLKRVALIVRHQVGGTSGPLYAVFLIRAAASLQGIPHATPLAVASALQQGVVGVMQLGGAVVGDRTLLDALVPAVNALEQSLTKGGDIHQALKAASSAADTGAISTKSMLPRKGRSTYVGERALGTEDPGARAIATIFAALGGAY